MPPSRLAQSGPSLGVGPSKQALSPSPTRSTSHMPSKTGEECSDVTAVHNNFGQAPSTPSKTFYNSLLNASPYSPALRARASTASSSRAPSILDDCEDGRELSATPDHYFSVGITGTKGASPSWRDSSQGEQAEDLHTPSDALPVQQGQRINEEADDKISEAAAKPSMRSDDARRGLKELVRRSAAQELGKSTFSRSQLRSRSSNYSKVETPADLHVHHHGSYSRRHYYVLTNAGKPVFSSREDSSEDNATNLMGVAQALISIFAEDDDRVRCMVKGRHRIAFLLKAPLYLFCVSDWGEPEHVLRSQLEYIHLHILSVVTSTQISRMFQKRSNSDLSRLLDGTETFLQNLIHQSQYDFCLLTATLQPLRMAPAVRDTAAAALMPPSRFQDLLYVLLIAGGHIVTLLRPRKHSIHPSDLHLLLNTIASSATLRSTETWLPMCFPKFNPSGFVHAYISYVMEDISLVFVSADRESFGDLRAWKETVLKKLEDDGCLNKINDSISAHPYTISALGCPGLRHFIYKSRQHVQITQPEWEAPYSEETIDRKRLITLYQKLHDAVHAKSGQTSPSKLIYLRTEQEACLAWATKPFELYLTVSPQLSKSAVVAVANNVAKWVVAEENKIFLKDAPVF